MHHRGVANPGRHASQRDAVAQRRREGAAGDNAFFLITVAIGKTDRQTTAQDAFLALWRGIDRFRQESSLSTWIYRLASNACIDLLRRRKKQGSSLSLDDEELFLDAVDPAPRPQDAVEHREAQKLLQEGLSALPEEYRKVLILREIEGLSYTEIAESASLELGTVKSRISRGRVLLRNFLSGSGNFFEIASSKVTECNQKEMSAK